MKHPLALLLLLLLALSAPTASRAQDKPAPREVMRLGRGTANTLAWRPDGKLLAVGGSAGLWFYDVKFQQVAHYPAESIDALDWSPDSKQLAVYWDSHGKIGGLLRWSPDGTRIVTNVAESFGDKVKTSAVIRDAATGSTMLTIPDINSGVPLAWSPDSTLLAGVAFHGEVAIWSASSGERLHTFSQIDPNHTGIGGVAFKADGHKLYVVTSEPSQLYIWDILSGQSEIGDMNMLSPFVDEIVQQPHKSPVAIKNSAFAGTYDVLYVFGEGVKQSQFLYLQDFIVDFSWMPDTDHITVLTGNGMLNDWNISTNEVKKYQRYIPPSNLLWSYDSHYLVQASGTYGEDIAYPITLWNIADAQNLSLLYDPPVTIYPLLSPRWFRWRPDSSQLITFSDNAAFPNAMCIDFLTESWDMPTGKPGTWGFDDEACGIGDIPLSAWEYVAEWNHDFSKLADAGGNSVGIYPDIPHAESRLSFQASAKITAVHWSPDDTRLLTTSVDEATQTTYVEVWNAASGKRLATVKVQSPNTTAAWSPDGKSLSLVTSDVDNKQATVHVVDSANGKIIFERQYSSPVGVLWSGETRKIAIIQSNAHTLQVLDADSGAPLKEFHFDRTVNVDWHPNRDILAIGVGQEVSFYSGVGEKIVSISIDSGVGNLHWSPDGSKLALGMDDGTIRIWDVSDIGVSKQRMKGDPVAEIAPFCLRYFNSDLAAAATASGVKPYSL